MSPKIQAHPHYRKVHPKHKGFWKPQIPWVKLCWWLSQHAKVGMRFLGKSYPNLWDATEKVSFLSLEGSVRLFGIAIAANPRRLSKAPRDPPAPCCDYIIVSFHLWALQKVKTSCSRLYLWANQHFLGCLGCRQSHTCAKASTVLMFSNPRPSYFLNYVLKNNLQECHQCLQSNFCFVLFFLAIKTRMLFLPCSDNIESTHSGELCWIWYCLSIFSSMTWEAFS